MVLSPLIQRRILNYFCRFFCKLSRLIITDISTSKKQIWNQNQRTVLQAVKQNKDQKSASFLDWYIIRRKKTILKIKYRYVSTLFNILDIIQHYQTLFNIIRLLDIIRHYSSQTLFNILFNILLFMKLSGRNGIDRFIISVRTLFYTMLM